MTSTKTQTNRAINRPRPERSPTLDTSRRRVALTAAIGLLLMAILAPLAHFGVLENLIVEGDAATTVRNIVADEGLFRLAIAALLAVTFLDIIVAWALYVLLKPVNETLALLVGWLRLAAPAVFAVALSNLLDVANLLGTADASTMGPEQLGSQVMASIASFHTGWIVMSLAIFGLHLLGVGYLLFKSANFPRFLGVLVVVAGAGYLADSFVGILVPEFDFTFSEITFVGEPLLIFWLFWMAIKGFARESEPVGGQATETPLQQPTISSS